MDSEIVQGYEQRDGERWGYYQWDPPNGKRYYYTPKNERARKSAKTKADNQRQAAAANTFEG